MEKQMTKNEPLWRVWVDTRRRIVSFHEEEGCQMMEFRSREMFLSCVDQYTGMQYRYQRCERTGLVPVLFALLPQKGEKSPNFPVDKR